MGIDAWTVHVTANAYASGDLNNSVFIEGSCLDGCIYSQSSDQAYTARLNITKEPDSVETIGDKVNFTITAEFWGIGEFYNETRINDTLPIGLKYYNWTCKSDSCSGCVPCGGIGNFSIVPSGGNSILSWNLGNFTGPRVIAINLSTIAKDVVSNRAGTNILNRVDASHMDETGRSFQAYDTANVTLVEPDLQILKSANVTETDAGSVILYNITLNHSSLSGSPAYDVNITDIIPSGLKLISATPTPNSSFANGVFWNFPVLPVGGIKNLSYIVTVNSSITAGEVLRNLANVTWTSTTGPNPDERFGNYTTLDNYNRSASYPITAKTQSGLIKLPDGSRIRTIGEKANYTIQIDLPKNNLINVWVNDTLPAGLKYDTASLEVKDKNGLTLTPGDGIPSLPNDGTAPVVIKWDFGNFNNSEDRDIVIKFNVTVADVIGNQAGIILGNNNATLKWRNFGGSTHFVADESGPIALIEPDLQIIEVCQCHRDGRRINHPLQHHPEPFLLERQPCL